MAVLRVSEALREELLCFESVRWWVDRLEPSTAETNLYVLRMWLRWMGERGLETDIDRLVEMQKRAVGDDRYRILDLIQGFVGGMEGRSSYKRRTYAALRSLFAHNRAELPRDGSFQIRGDAPPVVGSLTVDDFRRILGGCNRMYRAIYLSMFQGGMGIAEFSHWNLNGWPSLEDQLAEGRRPIRVDLPGRKRNRNEKPFYTFLGRDAVDALRLYLDERPDAEVIFVNQYGRPVSKRNVQIYWLRRLQELGLIEKKGSSTGNRYGMNPHELRDLFRSRWRPSGADSEVAEFFMGHDLDRLGYDKSPWHYPEWFEEQYLQAESWLNIVSEDPERVPLRDHLKLRREILELREAVKEAEWLLSDTETARILRGLVEERRKSR